MSRVTIITGPDGKVTRIVTRRSGCGCLTALAFVVVVFVPAAYFGPWAVPAYVGLGALIVTLFSIRVAQEKKKRRQAASPPPAPPMPPPVAAPPESG
jgi:hypothetical protein